MTHSDLIEWREPGLETPAKLFFTEKFLQKNIKTFELAVFFADLYKLTNRQFSDLLDICGLDRTVWDALVEGGHSTELQDYELDLDEEFDITVLQGTGQVAVKDDVALVALFEAAAVVIADSIQEVADALGNKLGSLPVGEAQMMFSALHSFNVKRNSIGDFKAGIYRDRSKAKSKVLVILDDSGSVTPGTIEAIADDVVQLSYSVNASLAMVSSTTRYFQAGTFNTQDVLSVAEYGGTQYETLAQVLSEDWDEVITIADYDSSPYAKMSLAANASCRIKKIWDIGLENQSSYLAECLSQFAESVSPIVIRR